jgi:hypothetical protein
VEVITPDGFPDLFGVWDSRARFIELKALGDRVRPSQAAWLRHAWLDGLDAVILKCHRDRIAWYRDIGCMLECDPPDYWMP